MVHTQRNVADIYVTMSSKDLNSEAYCGILLLSHFMFCSFVGAGKQKFCFSIKISQFEINMFRDNFAATNLFCKL